MSRPQITTRTRALVAGLALGLPLASALPQTGSAVGATAPSAAGARPAACRPWMSPQDKPAVRAQRLVRAMTQTQKLHTITFSNPSWFTYYGTAGHITGLPELCVPDLVLSDAGSGVAGLSRGTTTFPSGVTQAATWDPATQRAIGRTIGAEAHAKGINGMLGPGMNIARTPYNGRNFEYFGEDPYLSSTTAVAFIKGIQDNPVLADAKHYALNDQEIDRNTVDVRADERTRREIYLPPFEASVKRGHVGSVMCSYNIIDGKHACENANFLTSILRKQWGFDGFVVSDWGAVHSLAPSANAGLDLEMYVTDTGAPETPVSGASKGRYFGAADFQAAIDARKIKQQRLDTMVRNIVRPMFREGLFEHPIEPGLPAYSRDVSAPHLALARRAAAEGTVLLKNQGSILPLSHAGGRTIALIGWAAGPVGAANSVGGGGSSRTGLPGRVVSPLEGLTAQALEYGDRVVYVDGTSTADAVAAASAADLAVVVANDSNTEGGDRPDLGLHPGVCATILCTNLPVDQTAMVDAVTKANPRTIVALDIGAPVKMPWLAQAKAVLVPWYAGLQHGNALADVLYGNAEPGGRLPQTFPVDEKQIAMPKAQYPGVGGIVRYSEKLLVGYRWFDKTHRKPLFPFGYGLGYTTFSMSDLHVRKVGTTAVVSLRVTNTGKRTGSAVPQVYVGFPRAAGEPPRQLKGFTKLKLAPGASRVVRIRLDPRAFAHWGVGRHAWVVSPGSYRIFAGTSSRALPLRSTVRVVKGAVLR